MEITGWLEKIKKVLKFLGAKLVVFIKWLLSPLAEDKEFLSVRRLLAGFFAWLCYDGITRVSSNPAFAWQLALVIIGVPAVMVILLLLFTTWTSVIDLARVVKGEKKDEEAVPAAPVSVTGLQN